MESLIKQMRDADNGTHIDGFGHVIGYTQSRIIRSMAELMERELSNSPMTFNVVRYMHNGIKLDVPIFYPNLRILGDFDGKMGKCCIAYELGDNNEKTIKVTLDRVIATSFKSCGIWVEGLQLAMATPDDGGYSRPIIQNLEEREHKRIEVGRQDEHLEWRSTYTYQRLLLTNMDVLSLHENKYFW